MPTTAPYSPAPTGSTLPPYTPGPSNSRRPVIITAIIAGVVVFTTAIVVGGIAVYNAIQITAPPSPSQTVPVSNADRQARAQAHTCDVLKSEYAGVSDAINARNKFVHQPWTDPGRVDSSATVASVTKKLADDLDASLSVDTPTTLRSAIVNYVAALRAMSVSENTRASDKQLNGVAAFYNNVVDAPLNICGIEG